MLDSLHHWKAVADLLTISSGLVQASGMELANSTFPMGWRVRIFPKFVVVGAARTKREQGK